MAQRTLSGVLSVLALFARYWAASAALVVVVVAASAAQMVAAPRHYIATQQLQVVVLPVASAAEDASPVARALVDPALLDSPRLASDVLARIPANEEISDGVSAEALRGALSASHSGASVTLSASWTSRSGAEAILDAAVNALQSDGSLLPSGVTSESVRVQAVGAASPATRSTVEADAATQTLVQRILMAVAAALLLPFALDALLANRTLTRRSLAREG